MNLPRVLAKQAGAFVFVAMLCVAFSEAGAAPVLDPQYGVGSWIWDHQTRDRQECRLVRSFTIPSGVEVESARLRISADNFYQVFLDGQPVGQGGDWRVLIEYELHLLLTPGEHVLAVSASNDFDVAGLLLGLRIALSDGSVIEIGSDDSWKIVPPGESSWKKRSRAWESWAAAKVIHPFRPEAKPQIYRAPVSQPVEIALWQRRWFQIALVVVAVSSLAAGLFLASRLLLKSQMEKVVRRERARIAADLHDDLGGGLTQLVLLGETTRREVPEGSREADALGRLSDQSRRLLSGMNESVWLINSQRDTIRDFASYVAKYAESFFQNSGVRCRFDIESDLPRLPCDLGIRRNLFLAAKEALHNVLRHAEASAVELSIGRQRGELVMSIRDDGKGFDLSAPGGEGNGLRNMQLRATEAGGSCIVESRPGQGAKLEFRVPLQEPGRRRVARLFPWNRRRRAAE